MRLGRVIGTVVSTIKLDIYRGYKILVVQPIDPDGMDHGGVMLALDTVQAGVGDRVLVIDEGNSARVIINDSMAPVRCVVAGIVDEVQHVTEAGDGR
jgi:microcompartment protein CcmK/EutM